MDCRRRIAVVVASVVALVAAWSFTAGPFVREPPIRNPDGAWLDDGPRGTAVVWAIGNGADGSAAAREVADMIEADDPDRVLYLGDVYARSLVRRVLLGEGTRHDFTVSFDSVYGDLAARIAPTPGNHEWPRRGAGYEPYWRDVHGSTPPAWYEFELAGWQLLALNSEAPHDDGSAQVAWARRQVEADTDCRIAFWHESRFSAARAGGDQPDLDPLWETLAGRAALVVSAHDHNLQRLEPVDGITPFVVGAGGHGHHRIEHDDPRLAFGDDERFGALRLQLEPGRARFELIAVSGRILDAGSIRCATA